MPEEGYEIFITLHNPLILLRSKLLNTTCNQDSCKWAALAFTLAVGHFNELQHKENKQTKKISTYR